MLKVFLVEDEYIVRESIKKNIDWEKEGFIFCGEAADGEIAYKLILTEQPDIIITDIRMPFIDGLELSRLVKNKLPQSKIIILSGYDEFSYARDAIEIGVTEYLLKPISGVELIKSVNRVGNEILDERRSKENIESFKHEVEANRLYMKYRLLEDIVKGRLSAVEILEQGKSLGIEMCAENYQIVLFRYSIKNINNSYPGRFLEISQIFDDINSGYKDIIVFERMVEGSVLLIKGDKISDLENTLEKYIKDVEEALSIYPEVSYFGGIGKPVSRLTSIVESYESATLTFTRRFIMDKNTFTRSDESIDLIYEGKDEYIDVSALETLNIETVEEFLKNGEANEISYFVKEFLRSKRKTGQDSLLLAQYLFMNIHFTIITFLKNIGRIGTLKDKFTIDREKLYNILVDIEKTEDYLIELFTKAIEQRDLLRTKGYYNMIEQAKEYITNNYEKDNISLREVAEHVNVSPSHFSMLFSRETGETYIKYLTDLRMERAREYLKCTNLTSSEISVKVGYKDPQYFSYIFKKEHKCTPLQYRGTKE